MKDVLMVCVGRLMRHVAAMEVVLETGPDEYKLTNFSKTLTIPKYADGFPCMYVSLRLFKKT